jgi:hypothetical protein
MNTIGDPRVGTGLKARVEGLSLASPRRWGKMNVQQMLAHLAGGMEKVLAGEPFGPPPDSPRTLLKVVVLKVPLPWPKGARSSRDPAGVNVPESDFEPLRQRVIEALEAMAAWSVGPDTPQHPAFGPLTTWVWQRWAYKHADHHLKQFSA